MNSVGGDNLMGTNNILVRIRREGYTAILQTFDRTYGRSAPYRVHVVFLKRALENDPPTYHRCEDSFLTMQRRGDSIQCSVVWLSGNKDDLRGHEQRFELAADDVENIVDGTTDRSVRLCRDRSSGPRVVTEAAGESIRNALKDKRSRRALVRLMRDLESYGFAREDTVFLISIGGCDFAFDTLQGDVACGQLRLRKEPDGRYYYILHRA